MRFDVRPVSVETTDTDYLRNFDNNQLTSESRSKRGGWRYAGKKKDGTFGSFLAAELMVESSIEVHLAAEDGAETISKENTGASKGADAGAGIGSLAEAGAEAAGGRGCTHLLLTYVV